MLKRFHDFAVTLFGLLCFWPLLLILSLMVRVVLGTPVLFRQQRPGRHGKPFLMYKFRTMTGERDAAGNLLTDSRRLTPFGRFLRSSSLDELPELLNVLRGEMGLVGPRPLLMESCRSIRRSRPAAVKPELTGWAQVNA